MFSSVSVSEQVSVKEVPVIVTALMLLEIACSAVRVAIGQAVVSSYSMLLNLLVRLVRGQNISPGRASRRHSASVQIAIL